MNQSEWLTSTDPHAMLDFLRSSGPLSERKLRLFACACCPRIWHLLDDERSQVAVEVLERFVDGQADACEMAVAIQIATNAADQGPFIIRESPQDWAAW